MTLKAGDRIGPFVVISAGIADAVRRWSFFHHACVNYEALPEGFEKDIIGACLDDEYEEMKQDPAIMGPGLFAYNEELRLNA